MSSVKSDIQVRCSACGAAYEVPAWRLVDGAADPGLKEAVKNGSLFVRECPECGKRELLSYPMIYRDEHLLVCLSDRNLGVEGLEGVRGRLVPSFDSPLVTRHS